MTLVDTLFGHQREAVEFAVKRGGRGAIFHDPGLGKTRTALEIWSRLSAKRAPNRVRLLVIAPLSLLEAAWHDEARKYLEIGETQFRNIHRDGLPERGDAVPAIMVVNYEFFQRAEKVQKLLALMSRAGGEWCAVLDESSRIKNYRAATTKSLLQICKAFEYRIVMSGTPAPNCETEYWAQIGFVDTEVFGKSFNAFRNTYFHLERRGQEISTQGMVMTRQAISQLFKQGAEYKITAQRRAELVARMAPFVHRAIKEECLDLPPVVDEVRLVQLGPQQKRAYNEMRRNLISEIAGKPVVARVALSKVMKLREITSGFAMAEDESIVELGECPKMAELEDLVTGELAGRQVIVWCQFVWEIEKVTEMLVSCGGGVSQIYGAIKPGVDRDEAIAAFKDGRTRFLVAHPRSAAHGLTFVNCCNEIFFSLDYSFETYDQGRDRTHRIGQTQTCVYHHILAQGTIDEEILAKLRTKGSMNEIVDGLLR
jgi:SNF2 family DNA or RNA helicase